MSCRHSGTTVCTEDLAEHAHSAVVFQCDFGTGQQLLSPANKYEVFCDPVIIAFLKITRPDVLPDCYQSEVESGSFMMGWLRLTATCPGACPRTGWPALPGGGSPAQVSSVA